MSGELVLGDKGGEEVLDGRVLVRIYIVFTLKLKN